MNNHKLKEKLIKKIDELEQKIMYENSQNVKEINQKSTGMLGIFYSITPFDGGKSDNKEAELTSKKYLAKIDALKKDMRTEMEETEFERKLEIILNESNEGFRLKEGLSNRIHEIVT